MEIIVPTGHYVRSFKPIRDRLFAKITKDTKGGCWVWNGAKSKFGHGQITRGGYGSGATRLLTVHRVSWELHFGPIPAGLIILHKCDNPPCCNPDHLRLGTKADNSADMTSKGRQKVGRELPQAKLTEREVRQIRAKAGKMSQRLLATEYGVSQSLICQIQKRVFWKHI